MNLGKTLYITNRKDWHSWLQKNHNKEKEIWLIYYRKSSNKPRILYNSAVEEALCYGWIDSIIKNIDKEKFAQRFSPRKPKSILSEMNAERIRRLIKQKKMKVFPEDSLRGSVVEIEMSEDFRCEVMKLARKALGEVNFELLRRI
jgi:uncharacterized protein YdeI (YjbR/CyaY-like superfamily)